VAGYVVALLWTACGACAADLSAVGEVVEQLDTEPLARFLRQLDEEMYPVMPDFAVERIVADPPERSSPGRWWPTLECWGRWSPWRFSRPLWTQWLQG